MYSLYFVLLFACAGILQINSFPNPAKIVSKLSLAFPAASEGRKDNPDERGPYFQGDIVFPAGFDWKAGIPGEHLRWPNATVVYRIHAEFSEADKQLILTGMAEIEAQTCIRFREREDEVAYVWIAKGLPETGCWSLLGRTGVAQQLNLEYPGCVHKGVIIHELIHAIGFYHEQSREDRDDYVTINYSNVRPGTEFNFFKAIPSLTYNVSYDYGSLMHYSAYAFARDPSVKTIITTDPNAVIGQRNGLSQKDIYKINAMYCPQENEEDGGTLDDDVLALLGNIFNE